MSALDLAKYNDEGLRERMDYIFHKVMADFGQSARDNRFGGALSDAELLQVVRKKVLDEVKKMKKSKPKEVGKVIKAKKQRVCRPVKVYDKHGKATGSKQVCKDLYYYPNVKGHELIAHPYTSKGVINLPGYKIPKGRENEEHAIYEHVRDELTGRKNKYSQQVKKGKKVREQSVHKFFPPYEEEGPPFIRAPRAISPALGEVHQKPSMIDWQAMFKEYYK